jgi:predicted DNA-binding transcriptional regulator AlpA
MIKRVQDEDNSMPRKKTEYRPRQPGDVYSIAQFCVANGISLSTFYALKQKGQGPRLMKIGGRFVISPEAMADWRREREEEARSRNISSAL